MAIPNRLSCRAICSVVLLVHFSPLIGSPAVSLSISLWMASITAGVFFPPACARHLRPAPGPRPHPEPAGAVVPWLPCVGPDQEVRRSGDRCLTGAIRDRRTDVAVVRQAGWQTGQLPPA